VALIEGEGEGETVADGIDVTDGVFDIELDIECEMDGDAV